MNSFPTLSSKLDYYVCQMLRPDPIQMKQKERDELVRKNINLVAFCARRYKLYSKLSFDDLMGEGCIGLIYAIDKFKPDYQKKNGGKIKFSTYAYWWIRRFITRAIEKEKIVTVPTNISEITSRWKREERLFSEKFGVMPVDEEIAKLMKVDAKKVRKIKKRLDLKEISLDLPVGEKSLIDFIEGSNEKSFDIFRNKELLRRLFRSLDQREREILELYFGLEGYVPLTLVKIGKKFHLTRQRIHQIIKAALKKLRRKLNEEDKPR